jgi:hypothetical protein
MDYSFDYSKQPSRAMFKYRKAFMRWDDARYNRYIAEVNSGRASMHAGNVAPYELVQNILSYYSVRDIGEKEAEVLNATWASMPDYCDGGNSIAVVDGSGSMFCVGHHLPAAVALSLGVYLAEHSKGAFAGHFITFSRRPQLVELKGSGFVEKVRFASTYSEVANTDLKAVFTLLLSTAVKHRVPQEELPSKIVIISDMEFDWCVESADQTVFENAKKRFAAHGYRLPDVVFWNVQSRSRQQPVKMNDRGVALVSGVTPRIFEMVAGGLATPYKVMMDILGSERYAKITA